MTAGFLNESGDFVVAVNERTLSNCPLCGKAPYLAQDEHGSYRLYCGQHQDLRTLWYSSIEKAETEWNTSVREVMTPKSPNTVSTIAFTNEDHDKFISFLSEEV